MNKDCGCPVNEIGDICCHICGERVNKRCWKCGTLRSEGPCPNPRKALYICGPMTGYPGHNLPAFAEAEIRLTNRGFTCLNPGSWESGKTWDEYMRLDLAMVLRSDGVATLPGWAESRRAQLEVHVANALEIPVLPIDQWIANVSM